MKLKESQFKKLRKIIENLLPEEKESLLSGIRQTIEKNIPNELRELPRINHHPYEIIKKPFGYKVEIYYRDIEEKLYKEYFWKNDLYDICKNNNVKLSYDDILKIEILKPENLYFKKEHYDPNTMISDELHWRKYCFVIKNDLLNNIKEAYRDTSGWPENIKNHYMKNIPNYIKSLQYVEILDVEIHYDVFEDNESITVDMYFDKSNSHFKTNPHMESIIINNFVKEIGLNKKSNNIKIISKKEVAYPIPAAEYEPNVSTMVKYTKIILEAYK